jgi:cytochrome d ubiquinol oxidase subunit I
MKLAAMEDMYETEQAPASFTLFAIPTGDGEQFAIRIPWVFGLIATRTFDQPVVGINDLVTGAEERIQNGITAYKALAAVKADPTDEAARTTFNLSQQDLGYALLLKKYRPDVENATPEQVRLAALDTVPDVWPLFWSFRIMVAIGFFFIAFFAFWFWKASRHTLDKSRFWLWVAALSLPLPYIGVEVGWLVAEYGRQPWVVEGVLPTFYAASGLAVSDLVISLGFFVLVYTVLLAIMIWLMVRVIKAGPSNSTALDDLSSNDLRPGLAANPEPAE